MNRSLAITLAAVLSVSPLVSSAADLTPDEQEFINQHTSDLVKFETQRLDDEVMQEVFSAPFYSVKITLGGEDSGGMTTLIVARVGDKLVNVTKPGTDAELPDFVQMLKPELRLRSTGDATMVQKALDTIFPPFMESERKLITFKHTGTTWIFVRGEFFESKSGYVFETDADGAIQSVKYMLRLP
jgi:hypothetical protein